MLGQPITVAVLVGIGVFVCTTPRSREYRNT
jgi:hypothetical protein